MNTNNLAQKTNFIAGSDKFEHLHFYLTSLNIPGMNFSHPEIGGRDSVKMKLPADIVTFNTLSFEMLIDEDYKIYREFLDTIRKHISIETGTFGTFTFDFWIELSNSKGHKVMKLNFSNCRIDSIGDITLNTQDESTEHTLPVEISFDYYEIEENPVLTQNV